MSNLLRLIVGLAEDEKARAAFRADPDAALLGFSDLCGEDVAAAIDVARVQVEPAVAERLTDMLTATRGRGETPRDVAVRSLRALCDSLDDVVRIGDRSPASGGAALTSDELPDRPPGMDRPVHLWAVGATDEAPDNDDRMDDRPASGAPLSPVPDPPGGFEFSPLELVGLPDGLPDEDIEPGAVATIVAVHREPELSYEIEISDDEGGRRFLGVVPTSAVTRLI